MEHLKLKNFGPITELDINLKKINVFIGEQGVGKSTIAKLLTCLRDVFLRNCILEDNTESISDFFSLYCMQDYFNENTFIEYSDKLPIGIDIDIIYKNGMFKIANDNPRKEALIKFSRQMLSEGLQEALAKHGIDIIKCTKEELGSYCTKYSRSIRTNMHTSLYCPAERGLIGTLSKSLASILVNEIPLPAILIEYMSFFEKARNYFHNYSVDFLNLQYTFKDGDDLVTLGGKSVPLKDASSGIQAILPLMMVMDYCLKEKYFDDFTIEEPELNLFPNNQLGLLRFLLSRTNDEGLEIRSWALTTHSPYTLSILNISLLAGMIVKKFPDAKADVEKLLPSEYTIDPDEICVYALKKDGENKTHCESIISTNGLISANYLDSVSESISDEFRNLNRVYISQLRANSENA